MWSFIYMKPIKIDNAVKTIYKGHPMDQQNVVLIQYTQVVFMYRFNNTESISTSGDLYSAAL